MRKLLKVALLVGIAAIAIPSSFAQTFRAESHLISSTANHNPGEPTGTASGDVLIGMVAQDQSSASTPALPTGWTSLYSGTSPTGGGSGFKFNIGCIVRGASAVSTTFTNAAVYTETYILAISGANGSCTPDSQSASGSFQTNAGHVNANPPATTAVASSSLAIAGFCNWNGNSGGYTASTGYTFRTNNANGNDCGMESKALAAAGSEDPGAVAGTGAGTGDLWNGFTITLAPPGSGGVNNNANISDSFTTSPAVIASAGRSAAISDSVTTSAAVSVQSGKGVLLNDSFTTSPSISLALTTSWGQPNAFTTSDALNVQAGKGAPMSDAFTTSPAVTAQATHNAPISESLTSSPAIQASAGRSAAIADSITTTPAIGIQSGKGAPIAVAWTTSVALVTQAAHNALQAEGWTTTPSLVANAAHSASNAEAFTTSPAVSVQAGKGAPIAVSFQTSDAVQVSVVRGSGFVRRRVLIISQLWPPDRAGTLQPFAADFRSFSTGESMSVGLRAENEAL